MRSKALSKIQAIGLSAIIIVAAITGFAAYYSWSSPEITSETIKIGVCADLDSPGGKFKDHCTGPIN